MRINLLPPKIKTELFEEKIKNLITILGILVLFFFLSLSLILFAIKTYISGQVAAQEILVDTAKKELKTPAIQELKGKIRSANQTLSELNSFYQEQVNLIGIFKQISEILPPKVYLTSFSYQKATAKVSLAGFAPQQEDLLEFRKNLKREFPDLYFPTQIKTTDIDFQVSFPIRK